MIDFDGLKKDFPIFDNDSGLVYLDSTATSLKPKSVVEKISEYYTNYSANIFRGVYKISEKATEEYEETRKVVSEFIGSDNPKEVVFTRNTTEAINLVAYSLGREIVAEGDEIVTSVMEHHSNFVPWQKLSEENGATLKVIDVDDEGYLETDMQKVITRKTKILALTYVSNVLGTINPIKKIASAAKRINPEIIVVVDAAQAVPHMKINVKELGVDFLAFSGHKMLGPTGVGVLWGRYELLEKIYPFNYGGEMIEEVHLQKSTFKKPPHKFEAGTPAIGEVIALKSAIAYLNEIGMENVRQHEMEITRYAIDGLMSAFGEKIEFMGPPKIEDRGGVLAFVFGSYHPHDVASILDEENVAVRAGHHCAMPLHERFGVNATIRSSFYIYTSKKDVDKLISGLKKVEKTL